MYTRDMIRNIKHEVSDSHNKKTELLLDVMEDLREAIDRIPDDMIDRLIVHSYLGIL